MTEELETELFVRTNTLMKRFSLMLSNRIDSIKILERQDYASEVERETESCIFSTKLGRWKYTTRH